MPVSAYVQSALFLVLGVAALFGSAGTFAIAVFWIYLAILAAIFVASILLLDPDLARERMRPGGKKPPLALWLFSGVLVAHWIIAGLDRGRYHWSDTLPLWLQVLGLIALAGSYAFCHLGDAGKPVLFLGGAYPIRPRPTCRDERALCGHSTSGLSRGHRCYGGQWCRARVLDRDGLPGDHHTAVSPVSRGHRRSHSASGAAWLSGLRRTRTLAARSRDLVRGTRDLVQSLNVAR